MSVFYIDTSAALKLLAEETYSTDLAAFYDSHTADWWVSSALLRIELMRAVRRAMPAAIATAGELLQAFDYVAIDDAIVDTAAAEPDEKLCSLDAIHLTTARVLADDLAAVVTYDDRMARAATAAGLPVEAPGRVDR